MAGGVRGAPPQFDGGTVASFLKLRVSLQRLNDAFSDVEMRLKNGDFYIAPNKLGAALSLPAELEEIKREDSEIARVKQEIETIEIVQDSSGVTVWDWIVGLFSKAQRTENQSKRVAYKSRFEARSTNLAALKLNLHQHTDAVRQQRLNYVERIIEANKIEIDKMDAHVDGVWERIKGEAMAAFGLGQPAGVAEVQAGSGVQIFNRYVDLVRHGVETFSELAIAEKSSGKADTFWNDFSRFATGAIDGYMDQNPKVALALERAGMLVEQMRVIARRGQNCLQYIDRAISQGGSAEGWEILDFFTDSKLVAAASGASNAEFAAVAREAGSKTRQFAEEVDVMKARYEGLRELQGQTDISTGWVTGLSTVDLVTDLLGSGTGFDWGSFGSLIALSDANANLRNMRERVGGVTESTGRALQDLSVKLDAQTRAITKVALAAKRVELK